MNSALYPIIDHLQRLLQFQRGDTSEIKLTKLGKMLATYRFANERVVPLIASLLSVPVPEGRYPTRHSSPQQQKQETQEALLGWRLEEADRQPLLAVCEDLHWADPSTIELLGLLIDHVPTARMLAIFTSRPEFQPPWNPRSYLAHLTLNRLTRPQAEQMIAEVVKGKRLPQEVVRAGHRQDRRRPALHRGITQDDSGVGFSARGSDRLHAASPTARFGYPYDPAGLFDGSVGWTGNGP